MRLCLLVTHRTAKINQVELTLASSSEDSHGGSTQAAPAEGERLRIGLLSFVRL